MSANLYLTDAERRVLEDAKVGVAGAGGLGSNCAMHLVRAGVTRLVVADFDVVCASNLNRQFFFRDQVGRLKVDALAENLRRIDPSVEIEACAVRVDADNAAKLFSGCDVVVEAFDSAEAKSMLLASLLPRGFKVVAASGIAGWGRSSDIALRRVGRNLVLVGDGESGVGEGMTPVSPRVGIAAAMQANSVVSLLLGKPL
jgi:sulfur carrier protein ThiS adenylyltransferase